MADFATTLANIANPLDSGISMLQKGYNFFKDVTNTDNKRAAALNKELMQYQFGLDQQGQDYNLSRARALLSSQAVTQEKLMEKQLGLQKELMAKTQAYNVENAERQFLYNQFLSSKARDIYQQRAMGINPSGEGSVAVGSTGLPTAPQGSVSASSPSASIPSTSVGSSLQSSSHYASPSNVARNFIGALNDIEDYKYKLEQNKYKDVRAYLEVCEQIESIRKNRSSSDLNNAETKQILDMLEDRKQELWWRIRNLQSQSEYTEEKTNYINKEFELEKWYKEHSIEVQRLEALTHQGMLSVEKQKLPAVVDELQARASQLRSKASLDQQEVLWFADRVESMIEVNEANIKNIEAQAELYKNKAKLAGKDLDWYEEKIIYDQVMGVVDTALGALGLSAKRQVASEAAKRVNRKVIRKTEGRTPQGRKTETTESWDWYETQMSLLNKD